MNGDFPISFLQNTRVNRSASVSVPNEESPRFQGATWGSILCLPEFLSIRLRLFWLASLLDRDYRRPYGDNHDDE